MGNAEQTLSRDVMRLAHQMDIFRHFSFYYSSVGHFANAAFGLFIVFLLLYFKLFMALTEAEGDLQVSIYFAIYAPVVPPAALVLTPISTCSATRTLEPINGSAVSRSPSLEVR